MPGGWQETEPTTTRDQEVPAPGESLKTTVAGVAARDWWKKVERKRFELSTSSLRTTRSTN
jgi:hypothetical protein